MRLLIFVAVLTCAPALFGQRVRPSTPSTGPSAPGTTFQPLNSGPANQMNPLVPLAPRPSPARPNPGFRGGRSRGFGGGAAIIPYPVYGGYNGFYSPPPGQYDPIWGIYNPGSADIGGAYQQTPSVVINQNFQPQPVNPQFRDYSNVQLPQPGQTQDNEPAPTANAGKGDQQTIYLIAMKDHTIYPALAYWAENGTLNYITVNGSKNSVSLDLVDRDFSTKLNDERGLSFRLPMPQ